MTDIDKFIHIFKSDIGNDSSLTGKWDKFEALITRMVHINPRLRPDCSEIFCDYTWSISNNEIEQFKIEQVVNDYPDHFFMKYIETRISDLKSKNTKLTFIESSLEWIKKWFRF